MRIDLTDVEETVFLSAEGKHLMKVIGVDETKFTPNGNQILRVTMQSKNGEIYNEDFVLTEKALFRVKVFTKALKMPNVIDTSLMVGRYVYGNFVYEDYTKKDGSAKKIIVCKGWEESKLTNTLKEAPVVEVIQPEKSPLPDYDVDEDLIPFN